MNKKGVSTLRGDVTEIDRRKLARKRDNRDGEVREERCAAERENDRRDCARASVSASRLHRKAKGTYNAVAARLGAP
jgi:hypothetical protein